MEHAFTGMAELLRDLEALAPAVGTEAAHIITAATNAAFVEVRSGYRRGPTGNLIKGVSIQEKGPRWKVLRSRAPHAWLWERGTVARYTKGQGKYTVRSHRGTMPATPTFWPAVRKYQTRLIQQIAAAITRQRVRGMTGTLTVADHGD